MPLDHRKLLTIVTEAALEHELKSVSASPQISTLKLGAWAGAWAAASGTASAVNSATFHSPSLSGCLTSRL